METITEIIRTNPGWVYIAISFFLVALLYLYGCLVSRPRTVIETGKALNEMRSNLIASEKLKGIRSEFMPSTPPDTTRAPRIPNNIITKSKRSSEYVKFH